MCALSWIHGNGLDPRGQPLLGYPALLAAIGHGSLAFSHYNQYHNHEKCLSERIIERDMKLQRKSFSV